MFSSWVFLTRFVIAIQIGSQPNASDDDFERQLEYLRQQSWQTVGQSSLIAAYEKLIQQHSENPEVADAMLDLSSIVTNESPADGVLPDHKASREWLEKAAAKAVVGSDTWVKAQFLLAKTFENPVETRRILDQIEGERQNDLLTLVEVRNVLVGLSISEGKLDEAEKHTLAIMDWFRDPAKKPKQLSDKARIDVIRLIAAGEMMRAWTTAPWPKSERKRKVQEFINRYGFGGGSILNDGERALKHIDMLPDPEPTPITMLRLPGSAKKFVFVTLNILVILALLAILGYRRWWLARL